MFNSYPFFICINIKFNDKHAIKMLIETVILDFIKIEKKASESYHVCHSLQNLRE